KHTLMPRMALSLAVMAVVLAPNLPQAQARPQTVAPYTLELAQGWTIQSSCAIRATGAEISKAGFATSGWHHTTVPNTVVGSLVDDKTYPDPFFGTNLKNLPGMNYSAATFFANQDMPNDSPFKCSWWWRNEFTLPAGFAKKNIAIHFPGLNYRA